MSTLESLITALSKGTAGANAEAALSNYLRAAVGGEADWLNGGDKAACPFPVAGDKCIALLDKCLTGDAGCAAEWKALKFEGGFDANSMDIGQARALVTKMGITGSVAEWKAKQKASSPDFDLDPRVEFALTQIVNRVRNPSGLVAPAPRSGSYPALKARPVFSLAGAGMVGGGSRVNAVANFVQVSDYLKNQFVLVGGNGAPSSVAAMRDTLSQLETALQSKGKQIDATDKQRIQQLFDSLQSTEEKALKAAKYLSELRRLVNHPKFKSEVEAIKGDVTAKLMQDLTTRHSELLKAATQKSYNLLSILETIAGVADDVKAIKEKMASKTP